MMYNAIDLVCLTMPFDSSRIPRGGASMACGPGLVDGFDCSAWGVWPPPGVRPGSNGHAINSIINSIINSQTAFNH